ncbi:MAG TPA: hypothetical protein VMS17_25345 [Gemmataceae bacterium]|nr:hypothetical protein [Gemmataceae bacterium]
MRLDSPKRKGQSNYGGCVCLVAILVIGIGAISYFVANNDKPGGSNPFNMVKPPVPVVISYRESSVGQGKVAIFSNQTSNRLTITVEFHNEQFNKSKTVTLDLDPNSKMEIGWLEGWKFLSGETITVSHPDWSSKTVTVP